MLKDTTRRRLVSNPGPFAPESDTLPLSHRAPRGSMGREAGVRGREAGVGDPPCPPPPLHVKGTSLSKHLIQLTCPGTFSLVGRVSAPGNRISWVRSRATTYQSYQMVLGTQAERVELRLVDPASG